MARTTPSTSSGGRGSARVTSTRGGGAGSAARRKQVKPVKQRPWGLILASLLVAAFAIGAITYAALQKPADPTAIDGVQTVNNLENDHVTTAVTYDPAPPVGGDHDAAWQNCGVYSSPLRNENAVHSLEHGAVWFTYRPDLAADQVDKLRDIVNDRPGYRMLSPYPGLTSPVVASAWSKQLRVESADDGRLEDFANAFTQGPQTQEPGAACSGGVGNPG